MPKTLLIADDSITIQKVVGICLANEDVNIVSVDNGEDAVIKARAVTPDLVIADVVMPRKSGYEVCLAIRQDPELKHVPVILLAGAFETFDEKRYREVMANSYIIKPFESQTLITAVRKFLYPEQVQVGAAPAQPFRTPAMPPAPMPPPSRPVAPEMPPVPPHIAPIPAAAPAAPPSSAVRAVPPPPSGKLDLPAPPTARAAVPAPMAPPAPVMPPPAPRPVTATASRLPSTQPLKPAIPIVVPPLVQQVPSFEAALGPAPTPVPSVAEEAERPSERAKLPSGEVAMSDEISTAEIEEMTSSGVAEAVAPAAAAPAPPPVAAAPEVQAAPEAAMPALAVAEEPQGWDGLDIRQTEPEHQMVVEPTGVPEAKPTIEQWGIELKQELNEPVATAPQILTAAESAQEALAFEPPEPEPEPEPEPAAVPAPAPVIEAAQQPAPAEPSAATPAPAELSEKIRKSIREVVERVAWEVVPELAETIIREELKRLLAEEEKK